MPLRVQHIIPRKTLKNGLRFPGDYMLCSQRPHNLQILYTKTKSHPLLDGSSFERKEREKFGYMSSTPVTVGKILFNVFSGILCRFPLTVNRIPQECVKIMCKSEKENEIYK